ncbi:hypothetical protein QT972_11335, partial [Microcoleus sp. herbarium7]|uniref:hypothetical protein n=1 Tax=Microcoleus sp. herbarium7 TaxID=3055435 RepID=UPI002FD61125
LSIFWHHEMAPFMGVTWEGKSSWLGAGYTQPRRVRCDYLFADNISVFWGNVRSCWDLEIPLNPP